MMKTVCQNGEGLNVHKNDILECLFTNTSSKLYWKTTEMKN